MCCSATGLMLCGAVRAGVERPEIALSLPFPFGSVRFGKGNAAGKPDGIRVETQMPAVICAVAGTEPRVCAAEGLLDPRTRRAYRRTSSSVVAAVALRLHDTVFRIGGANVVVGAVAGCA